jgi:hypothetical protein
MEFYSAVDLACMDLDWWATDTDGCVGHFATWGYAPVPSHLRVVSDELLSDYFQNIAPIFGTAIESENWEIMTGKIITTYFKSQTIEDVRNSFLQSFRFMSQRGMFSYSGNMPNGWNHYYRLTVPSSPLTIDMLPKDIKNIVQEITFPVSFSQAHIITKDLIIGKQ